MSSANSAAAGIFQYLLNTGASLVASRLKPYISVESRDRDHDQAGSETYTARTTGHHGHNKLNHGPSESESDKHPTPTNAKDSEHTGMSSPVDDSTSPGLLQYLFMTGSSLLSGSFYPANCGTPQSVCFKKIGCFYTDQGPLRHLCRLPSRPEDAQIEFRLFLDSRPTKELRLDYNDPDSFAQVPKESKIVFIFHGNYETTHGLIGSGYKTMRTELLEHTDYSAVVFVDHSLSTGLTGQQDVIQSSMNVALAGRQVAYITHRLMTVRGIRPEDVYHICFSLGCSGAREAAYWSAGKYGFKIGRITVIEHSAVFIDNNADSFVTKNDATFVDVIHTGEIFLS